MTELDWEPAPTLDIPPVPRVRPWLRRELRTWARGCYPTRRGVTILWGWFFIIPWALAQMLKAGIFIVGVIVILLISPFKAAVDLCTYKGRRDEIALRVWTQYMAALHDKDVPPDMIP